MVGHLGVCHRMLAKKKPPLPLTEGHRDEPEWLSHVNANVLKVKLATAIIGISSIHLLKTFINASNLDVKTMHWQVVIHLTFVGSAVAIAYIDRLMSPPQKHASP